jgi:hypothetical protein
VAILGAMVATLGRSKIDQLLPHLPSAARTRLVGDLGSGGVQHGVPAQVVDAAQQAFVYSLHYGLLLGSGVALVGALAAVTLIRRRPAELPTAVPAQAGHQDLDASGDRKAEDRGRPLEPETVHA